MTSETLGRSSQEVADLLRRKIATREFGSGRFLPSIRVLCGKHHVALATVGKALRCLRDEGLIVAEPRRGYRVASPERALSRHAPLACVVDTEGAKNRWPGFLQSLVSMSETQALRHSRALLVINAHDRNPADILDQLKAAGVCGVLLDSTEPELARRLALAAIPTVLCETWEPGTPFDAVVQDDFGGAMQAAAYLARQGHERIGWLGAPVAGGFARAVERFGGAVAGLAQAGLTLRPEWRVEIPLGDPPAADRGARRLLSRSKRPTGILALWRDASQALARVARERALIPGRDFELVAWCAEESYEHAHRLPFAEWSVPPAMTWSVAELAKVAVARLEERMATPDLPPLTLRIPVRVRLPRAHTKTEARVKSRKEYT
jgi:LacI family transcriptional regulator